MKNKYQYYFLLIIIFVDCYRPIYSQKISGQIMDSKTNKGIPYALITNSKRTIGFTSDSLGVFTIPDITKLDSVLILSIGYRSMKIAPIFDKLSKIYLDELPFVLSETSVIGKKKWTKEKTGVLNHSDNGCFGGVLDANNEVALLIDNHQKIEVIISKVAFYIARDGTYRSPFRIRIYKNKNGKPDKEITSQSIVVNGYKRNGWNKFNFSNYKIHMPIEGCFISMEWLNNPKFRYVISEKSKNGIGQTLGLTTVFEFSRCFMRENEGSWYSGESGFTLKNPKSGSVSIYNPMIWIEYIY